MPYIHFTEDQKLRANSVDLVEFLRRQGEKLISSGQDKRLTSDHSITVHGNEWYEVPEKAQRFVAYADKQELEESIIRRHYGTIVMDSEQPQGGGTSAGGMAQGIQAAPDSRKTVFRP